MRSIYRDKRNHFTPEKFDLENNLDEILVNVHDPLGFSNAPGAYTDFYWGETQCMNSVVAGISESLGLPPGLSFDEVFNLIA